MDIQFVVAIISAIVALASAILSLNAQLRLAKFQAKIQSENYEKNKKEKAEQLLSFYNEPLLNAAYEFQGRLYNTLNSSFFQNYYRNGDENEKEYSTNNTLFVIAQYFCLSEIIRQEIQLLNLGEITNIHELSRLQENITQLLLKESNKKVLRIFRGEQRAIGEIMINQNIQNRCIGYATFVEKLQDYKFNKWFIKIKKDLDTLANELDNHRTFLIVLQNSLIDLINYLDPQCKRYPKKYRTKCV